MGQLRAIQVSVQVAFTLKVGNLSIYLLGLPDWFLLSPLSGRTVACTVGSPSSLSSSDPPQSNKDCAQNESGFENEWGLRGKKSICSLLNLTRQLGFDLQTRTENRLQK